MNSEEEKLLIVVRVNMSAFFAYKHLSLMLECGLESQPGLECSSYSMQHCLSHTGSNFTTYSSDLLTFIN